MIRTLYSNLRDKRSPQGRELDHFQRVLKKADLRKLRKSYNHNFKNDSIEAIELEDWAYLGMVLGHYALSEDKGYLQATSTLLKVNDFLVSQIDNLQSPLEKAAVLESLRIEQEQINKVGQKTNNFPRRGLYLPPTPLEADSRQIENLGMFLQETHRSKAYLQNLIHHGLHPNYVFLLKDPNKPIENLDSLPKSSTDTLFDPSISEQQSLEEAQIPYEVISATSCNDPLVVEAIKQRPEDYFIFSGRGILKEIFETNKKIIHVHPGKLPEYRGSTCPYYSTLAGDGWGCTSFIMKPRIDEGELISQKIFPPPSGDIDPTRIYDPFTRSEVLVETVKQLADTGTLKTTKQDLSKGIDYYIIHPVLEFIAKESFKNLTNHRI